MAPPLSPAVAWAVLIRCGRGGVGDGCTGSPTTRVRVRIPDAVFAAKRQPKAGWEIGIVKVKLSQPATGPHGTVVTEVVDVRGGTIALGDALGRTHVYDTDEFLCAGPSTPGVRG